MFTSPFVVQYENWFGSWGSWAASAPCHCVILRSLACARGTDHWGTYVEPNRSSRPPSSLLSLIGSGCSIRLFSSSSIGSASRAMSDISAISVRVWCAARKSDRTSSAIILPGTRRSTLKKMIAAVYRWTARSALSSLPCRAIEALTREVAPAGGRPRNGLEARCHEARVLAGRRNTCRERCRVRPQQGFRSGGNCFEEPRSVEHYTSARVLSAPRWLRHSQSRPMWKKMVALCCCTICLSERPAKPAVPNSCHLSHAGATASTFLISESIFNTVE